VGQALIKTKNYKLKPLLKYTEPNPSKESNQDDQPKDALKSGGWGLGDISRDWTANGMPSVSPPEHPYKLTDKEIAEDNDRRYVDQLEAFLGISTGPSVPTGWTTPKKPAKPEKLHIEPGRKAFQCKKCNKAGLYWGQTSSGKFLLCKPDGYIHSCN